MDTFILVPTDFSEAADTALKHAVHTAEQSQARVYLVHMCKSNKELGDAKTQLTAQVAKIDTTAEIENIVRVGDFKDIPQIAKELSVEIIFMGTHGATGMQKVMGSNALKLVTNSEVPYVIVQKDTPLPTGYKRILVPTSFHFESKQKIQAVAALAKYFKSVIYFIYREESDPTLKTKSMNNLKFMKKHLDKEGIKYGVKISSGKNFNDDTLTIALEKEAELIAIMNMQKNSILGTGLLGANYEQELIMNSQKIPVMIMNPRQSSVLGGVLMMRQ